MKVTIEAHGRTYSAELEDDIGAINQAVRGLLVAVGYHPNTVDDYFPNWEDYQEGYNVSIGTAGVPSDLTIENETIVSAREKSNDEFYEKLKNTYEEKVNEQHYQSKYGKSKEEFEQTYKTDSELNKEELGEHFGI